MIMSLIYQAQNKEIYNLYETLKTKNKILYLIPIFTENFKKLSV